MNYTSIEQSKKFLELGLNPESADMHYGDYEASGEKYPIPNLKDEEYPSPCWSVGALLKVMPSIIEKNDKEYVLELLKDIDDEPFYILRYYELGNIENDIVQREEANLLIVLYQMVVWLLENNYIKND